MLHTHFLRAKPAAFREDLERARALRHARVAPPVTSVRTGVTTDAGGVAGTGGDVSSVTGIGRGGGAKSSNAAHASSSSDARHAAPAHPNDVSTPRDRGDKPYDSSRSATSSCHTSRIN